MKNILKNKTLMNRLGFTLLAFLVYKLATLISLPMINVELFANQYEEGILAFLNAFTGDALKNFSIVALGIGPYITASIVVQLLQMDIVPIFKEWAEQGEVGKQKSNQVTRYLAIGLSFVQALALTIGYQSTYAEGILKNAADNQVITFVYLAILITAGTAFLLWLGDQITKKGIGNGVSMIIVAGIVSTMPKMIIDLFTKYIIADEAGTFADYSIFIAILLIMFLVLVGVIFMQAAVRKIPIQYANRPGGSQFRGKSDSNIPIKLNSAGVIPVIFAASLLSIPIQISTYIPALQQNFWIENIFSNDKPIGYVLYVALIFVFGFFYSFVQINPEKIANNLAKQNAYIPGVRPGEDTESYIARVLFKVTLVGALYLVIIASFPIFATMVFTLPPSVQVGGTSLLIVVGVALETSKQIQTEAMERKYAGFIKK